MLLTGEREELGDKHGPLPLCPAQIARGLARQWKVPLILESTDHTLEP
jgi:hypothetical protein